MMYRIGTKYVVYPSLNDKICNFIYKYNNNKFSLITIILNLIFRQKNEKIKIKIVSFQTYFRK